MLKNKHLIIGMTLVIFLVFYILFGFKAVLFLIIFALISLPFYLLLGLFELKTEEKIIFSFFIAIGLFSSFAYWLGFLFSSLRVAAIATFLLLIGYWFLFKKIKLPEKFREEIILMGLSSLVLVIGVLINAITISRIPVPEHVLEYLECLKENTRSQCHKLIGYMKF